MPARLRQVLAAHGGLQLQESFARSRLHGHDGDAELFGELLHVDPPAFALGDVDHVQRDDRGQAEFQDLGGQIEIALQVRGIQHEHDLVRLWRIATAA